jgi:NTP pyrophosphatase (non-canonical NTP hydrolase)
MQAAELNELFLWKTIKESEEVDKEKIKEELADVFTFAFLLANRHKFDVRQSNNSLSTHHALLSA